jgi:V8-like Glu-specific endopeptidase
MAQSGLTGEQWEQLHDAILSAFVSYADLRPPIRFAFDLNLNHIVTEHAPLRQQVTQLIDWAESQSKVKELVGALRRPNSGNPGNKKLAAFEATLAAPYEALEKLVSRNANTLQDPDAWRRAMTRAQSTVCRIEAPERMAWGTGFLIGPDLLLTNDHVRRDGAFDKNPSQVRCRFDYRTRTNNTPDTGRLVGLADQWLVSSSAVDGLDYALLRLAEKVGETPQGTFVDAPPRCWVAVSANAATIHQSLYILQHPKGETVKFAEGGLKRRDGAWLEYEVDTDEGSSGSPVFNNRWELVGLHSRAGQGEVNKGIDFAAILTDFPAAVRAELRPPPDA